jgi:hypothetical protein
MALEESVFHGMARGVSLLMRDEIATMNSGMSQSAKEERSQHKPGQQREVLVALFSVA